MVEAAAAGSSSAFFWSVFWLVEVCRFSLDSWCRGEQWWDLEGRIEKSSEEEHDRKQRLTIQQTLSSYRGTRWVKFLASPTVLQRSQGRAGRGVVATQEKRFNLSYDVPSSVQNLQARALLLG